MTMPIISKTWQFNINQALAPTANFSQRMLYAIKQSLIGFASHPWVVKYSCGGGVAGTAGDGIDRWTSEAAVVMGAPNAAHSWIVLEQAGMGGGGYQILLSATSEGWTAYASNFITLTIIESKSAGFTGGTTTTRPTAADEASVMNSGANVGIGGQVGTISSAGRALHAMQSTDGKQTRIVVCASNVAILSLIFDVPALRITSGWSNPIVAGAACEISNVNPFPRPGSLATQFCGTYAPLVGRIGSTNGRLLMTAEGTASGLSAHDANFGNVADELTGESMLYPLGLACITAGIRNTRATMVDLWAGSAGISTGSTYSDGVSNYAFAQFGSIVYPWDGVSVPLTA